MAASHARLTPNPACASHGSDSSATGHSVTPRARMVSERRSPRARESPPSPRARRVCGVQEGEGRDNREGDRQASFLAVGARAFVCQRAHARRTSPSPLCNVCVCVCVFLEGDARLTQFFFFRILCGARSSASSTVPITFVSETLITRRRSFLTGRMMSSMRGGNDNPHPHPHHPCVRNRERLVGVMVGGGDQTHGLDASSPPCA